MTHQRSLCASRYVVLIFVFDDTLEDYTAIDIEL